MLRGIAAYVRRHHIALLALFFALGGTAVAASNSLLPRNSVGSAQVINGSLQKKDLAPEFFGEGSTQNDAFDNTIFGARAWAIEQPLPQANATLNNLTNLPSRHIGAGLDARLLELSKGQVQ